MTRLLVVLLVLATGVATAAPVPKALKRARPLRATIEPLPGEKLHSVDWDDVPFAKVVEELEERSGLTHVWRDAPDVRITLRARDVSLWELFARLDDMLYPEGWVMVPRKQWFSTSTAKGLYRPDSRLKVIPFATLDDLDRRFPYAPAHLILDVGDGGVEAGEKVKKGIEFPYSEIIPIGSDKLIVYARVMDLQKFVDEMGDHIKK